MVKANTLMFAIETNALLSAYITFHDLKTKTHTKEILFHSLKKYREIKNICNAYLRFPSYLKFLLFPLLYILAPFQFKKTVSKQKEIGLFNHSFHYHQHETTVCTQKIRKKTHPLGKSNN